MILEELNIKIKKDIDFLVVIGPTASGKTSLSIELAKKYNGEIINGDSVQVYKELDIGSAKISKIEMQGIKHHLIDIKEPNEQYTVVDFQRDCNEKISEIQNKAKLPIIVGGTGLYINSIVYEYNLLKEKLDIEVKDKLQEKTNEELFEIVKEETARIKLEIHVNNRPRLINYAYKIQKNIPLKEASKTMLNCQIIALEIPRNILYERINTRVDLMIQNGLIDEVKNFNSEWPSQNSIGYKEVHEYLKGKIDKEELINSIKQNTRRFAKRQITWSNNQIDADCIKML